MRENNIVSKILTVLMVIECVIIAILVLVNVNVYMSSNYSYQDEDYLFSLLKGEEYSNLASAAFTNEYAGVRLTGDMEELHEVGKYTHAASLYRVYSAAGDTERADEYMDRMEDAYDEMGIYSSVVKDINNKLGITDFDM